jgi:hypothetical protein
VPEPFKNFFNPQMIALMGHHFRRVWSDFDEAAFVDGATHNLDALELKQRSDQIKRALKTCLPSSFVEAAPIILNSLHPDDDVDLSGADIDALGIRGWATMPMTQFVGEHGVDDFDLGMTVQRELTKRGSSEFGIRTFISRDQDRALTLLTEWARDQNFHVRRLVSDGSRPDCLGPSRRANSSLTSCNSLVRSGVRSAPSRSCKSSNSISPYPLMAFSGLRRS